jgi:hypothetical protein
MAKIIDRGLAPPGHPIYKQGWSSYIGPLQNEPSETASKDTPSKKSESTTPSDKVAAEIPAKDAEKTEE